LRTGRRGNSLAIAAVAKQKRRMANYSFTSFPP
jgi:hypothetical protein